MNGRGYRPYSRAMNVEMTQAGRDAPADISKMVHMGPNDIDFRYSEDTRTFAVLVVTVENIRLETLGARIRDLEDSLQASEARMQETARVRPEARGRGEGARGRRGRRHGFGFGFGGRYANRLRSFFTVLFRSRFERWTRTTTLRSRGTTFSR